MSQPNLKLIDLHTESDGSKIYEETEYFPPGGLLFIWEDILFLANVWAQESSFSNKYSVKLHRNCDGFPTAVVRCDDEIISYLGAVKSNSHPYQMQKIEGKF